MEPNASAVVDDAGPPSWPPALTAPSFSYSLVFGVTFAFLSQLSSIGKGMQKVGVQTLPTLTSNPQVVWQYLSNSSWRAGLLLDIVGALFGLVALSILPISVAQPIFCNGLVLLACYSHFYLEEQLHWREWRAIGLCFVGTVLLAVTLVPRDWAKTHIGMLQYKLSAVMSLVLPALCFLELSLRRVKRARGVPNRSLIELLTGIQAGLCIGVGNASLASGLQSTSRSWLEHLAKEHVGSDAWPTTSLTSGVWLHLLSAAAFVVLGATLNALHPFFANRGYQHGRVTIISTHTALVSMATGVFVGIAVLDEAWPSRPSMSATRFLAFGLMIYGVFTLNCKTARRSFVVYHASRGHHTRKASKGDDGFNDLAFKDEQDGGAASGAGTDGTASGNKKMSPVSSPRLEASEAGGRLPSPISYHTN